MHLQLSLFDMPNMEHIPPIATTAQELDNRVLYLKTNTMFADSRKRYYKLKEDGRIIDAFYLLSEFKVK